ncbi:MAG: DUF542 domain-containing protein [Thermoleophilia bacterium]
MELTSTSRTLAELVIERPHRARVFEQLGLDYCCGGQSTLAEACAARRLDAATVAAMLSATEAASSIEAGHAGWSTATLSALCSHIEDVHHAYLRRELPRISDLLAKVATAHADELLEWVDVRATFEELRRTLDAHLEDEEANLFPGCRAAEQGIPPTEGFARLLESLEDEHSAVGTALSRLAALTGRYDSTRARCSTHRAALHALHELEVDLHEHVHEENNVLFPRVLRIVNEPHV